MGVTAAEALAEHNLAPLNMRRDIAMLAILYKVSVNKAPLPIQQLFSLRPATLGRHGFTGSGERHSRQIADPVCPSHTVQSERSIFGLTRVYNRLPPHTVDAGSVTSFQSRLQAAAKQAAKHEAPNWSAMFHVNA